MINNTHTFTPVSKVFLNLPDADSLSFRFSQRSDMQTRIYAQMLYRRSQGYRFYFFTLTYAPKFRPYFTLSRTQDKLLYSISQNHHLAYSFADDSLELRCPCFSRDDITHFIKGIQKSLLKKYDVKDIDYIIASEYGSHSEFCPHYHGIFMVPSKGRDKDGNVININAFKVHELVKRHWSVVVSGQFESDGKPVRESRGFVLPRTCLGGRDRKGHMHKPFEVDVQDISSITKTAIYVSKYCCKQIGFWNNLDVKCVNEQLKKDGTLKEIKEFRSKKPFIKTSLHFGECLKDVVFGTASWSNGLMSASENPLAALYEGFHCPLKKPDKLCSFPNYIKRKLLHDNYLCDIQEDTLYDDDNLPYVRKSYKYGYELSEFGKEFLSYELKRSIFDYTKKMMTFHVEHILTDDYQNFLKANGYFEYYEFIKRFFSSESNIRQLAIYRKVYKDRVNPVFLWWYEQHKEDFVDTEIAVFQNSYLEFSYKGGAVKKGYRWLNVDFEKISAKSNLLSINFRQYCNFDDKFNFGVDFRYPYFDYNTCLHDMCVSAHEFYTVDCDKFNNPTNSLVAENYPTSLFFNCFPCFANFDLLLLLTDAYNGLLVEKKLKGVDTKEKNKSNYKNEIYAV